MNKITKSFFVLSLLLFAISTVQAQEAIEISDMLKDDDTISSKDINTVKNSIFVSDTLRGWDYSWVGGLNGSQAAYNNWSQGGVNTISVTASTVFNAMYRKDKFAYALSTNLKYGKARLEGEETRKTDDKIAINNKFSYLFDDERWSAFANINFATQFDQGFDYNVADGEDPILLSSFFAPAYFTQIGGIAFNPVDYFTAEAGLALKETIVTDTSLSQRYGLDAGEKFRFEPGYSAALNFDKNIFSNVRLISTVETFSNLQESIKSTDITFSNELIGKINDFLNTSLQFVVIYDDDFSKKAQIKQVLSVGVSFSLL